MLCARLREMSHVHSMLGNPFQDGDRYVDVLLLTLFLVFQFLSFISLTEKSQYTSRIKSLPLKSGECRYFDVSSLNEERYGTLIRLNLSLHVKVRTVEAKV